MCRRSLGFGSISNRPQRLYLDVKLWEQASRLRRAAQVTDAENEKTPPVARAGSREFAACEASGGRSNRASHGDSDRRTSALRFRGRSAEELRSRKATSWANGPEAAADQAFAGRGGRRSLHHNPPAEIVLCPSAGAGSCEDSGSITNPDTGAKAVKSATEKNAAPRPASTLRAPPADPPRSAGHNAGATKGAMAKKFMVRPKTSTVEKVATGSRKAPTKARTHARTAERWSARRAPTRRAG